ncbi:hypothetical protein ITJ64_15675 [Herbiconiux sp. VKM Ac-1786]|uniref:sensor histidine kinase n=1 Tax=Herbiconiux sp. VKM Ac-1786 TaxID=2783824 RepID=UPI00188C56D8|nr:hypothetical protein [Herbiconiux sp. VKM Ac-1786]MBF4573955.1 hypothetical protein [Herbiconiux sp. VKM Ac-1786]
MVIPVPAPEAPSVPEAPGSGEHLRLGIVCARRFGIIATVCAAVNLAAPEHERIGAFLPSLVGMLLMTVGFFVLTPRNGRLVVALTYCAALGTLGTFLLPGAQVDDNPTLATVTALASMAVPSLFVAVAELRALGLIVAVTVLPVSVLAWVVTAPTGRAAFVVLAIVGGWTAMLGAGLWLARSARQAEIGQARLKESYAAERRSTETEAELRYGARMMHDTVLATLTLIAHSGQGVPPETLRAQAANDSALLAQLRTEGTLGGQRDETPDARPAVGLTAAATATALVDPWVTVRAWCRVHGLEATWHGEDTGPAAPERRAALVAAVADSLETVRRHSGVRAADVTLSGDDTVLRAVVTDGGQGFAAAVPPAPVSPAEAAIATIGSRLAAAGGSLRVFASPGRGTTVLLEVPR